MVRTLVIVIGFDMAGSLYVGIMNSQPHGMPYSTLCPKNVYPPPNWSFSSFSPHHAGYSLHVRHDSSLPS